MADSWLLFGPFLFSGKQPHEPEDPGESGGTTQWKAPHANPAEFGGERRDLAPGWHEIPDRRGSRRLSGMTMWGIRRNEPMKGLRVSLRRIDPMQRGGKSRPNGSATGFSRCGGTSPWNGGALGARRTGCVCRSRQDGICMAGHLTVKGALHVCSLFVLDKGHRTPHVH